MRVSVQALLRTVDLVHGVCRHGDGHGELTSPLPKLTPPPDHTWLNSWSVYNILLSFGTVYKDVRRVLIASGPPGVAQDMFTS